MKAVVTAAQMQAIDRAAIDDVGIPGVVLMENAGRAVARVVAGLAPAGARVAVVCGTGNNGGDGHVVARVLRAWGRDACVLLVGDDDRVSGDARVHLDAYRRSGGPVFSIADGEALARHEGTLGAAAVVVDAIFGTGLDRPVTGHYRDVIAAINRIEGPVVAVDLPSGLSADSGKPLGIVARATHTVTMAFHKRATAGAPGFSACGEVTVAEIGIPTQLAADVSDPVRWVEDDDVRAVVPVAGALDYKNRRGHVLVVAGSPGKRGAGRLTASAALRSGAGLVTLGGPDRDEGADPSIMTAAIGDAGALEAAWPGKASLAIGPGMDPGPDGRDLVDAVLANFSAPVVIDADGLNHLVGRLDAVQGAVAVLTPHPGEASRLLGVSTADIDADRVGAARRIADRSGAVCVLKGARTVVATAESATIVPTGGPALATAGSGDVLTGVIAGLLAQGLEPEVAAVAGVYVHGLAGDIGGARYGERGLISSDLPPLVAEAFAVLATGKSRAI